jgi:hypothetical protein
MSSQFVTGEPTLAPEADERFGTTDLIEHGFSFPYNDFFVELLTWYSLQLPNIMLNCITAISNFVIVMRGPSGDPPRFKSLQTLLLR